MQPQCSIWVLLDQKQCHRRCFASLLSDEHYQLRQRHRGMDGTGGLDVVGGLEEISILISPLIVSRISFFSCCPSEYVIIPVADEIQSLPSRPGCPSSTGCPSIPGTPSRPGCPSSPGFPSFPGTPSCPGCPSLPFFPGGPGVQDTAVMARQVLEHAVISPTSATSVLRHTAVKQARASCKKLDCEKTHLQYTGGDAYCVYSTSVR